MKKFLLLASLLLALPSFAQTHSTTLTWNASVPVVGSGGSATQILTGYNVYRAAVSGGYITGTPFASVPFGTNTFVDTAVTAGGTEFYVVTVKCSNCATAAGVATPESAFSNEVTATTPLNPAGPPAAPTNLKATIQ